MLETTNRPEHSVWEIRSGLDVEYSLAVMEELRRLSVDGFNAFAHGGKEVGGALYGMREDGRIRITGYALLECEHALGPRFLLSDNDHLVMADLVQRSQDYECIGWFRAHTRGALDLDDDDARLFQRYFPQPMSVALILKPTHWGSISAAFFVRTSSGEIVPRSAQEFPVTPVKPAIALATPAAADEPPAVDSQDQEYPEPVTPSESFVEHSPLQELHEPVPVASLITEQTPIAGQHASSRRAWLWALCALVLLAAVTFASYFFHPAAPKLNLQTYAIAPGQVRIEWSHGSSGLPDNAFGLLQILDAGSVTRIPMDAARLRSGSMTYVQQSSHVIVRLKVEAPASGIAPTEESVEFVGALPAPPPLPSPPPVESKPEATEPVVAEVPPPAKPRIEVAAAVPPPTAVAHRQVPFRSILPPPRKSAELHNDSALLPVPPPVDARPAKTAALPEFLTMPTPRVNTPPPANVAARVGRLIWTGMLPRRGVIEIDGSRPSIGSLSGALPGVPLSVRILPAEFTRDGLIVYTADRARDGRVERPSPANGWNTTQFRVDGTRARQVVVLEYPNRANDFKHLVLRNDGRDCSVVLVDWAIE